MQKGNKLNILSLSYAKELFMSPPEALGDTLIRTLAYSEKVNSLTLIIHTLRKEKFRMKQLSSNCTIIPSNGINRPHSLLKIYMIANRIIKNENISIIQCQEPIFTGFIGLLLKKKYSIPINVLLYGGNIYDKYWLNQRKLNKYFASIGRYVIKKADSIQVEASLIKESLIENHIPENKIVIKPMVPNNLDDFNKANGDDIREQIIKKTNYDYIIFDTPAGLNNINVELALISDLNCLVITDEPTSLLDGYALIKVLREYMDIDKIKLIVNNTIDYDDGSDIATKMNLATEKFLGFKAEVIGIIPYSRIVRQSIIKQEIFVQTDPDEEISQAIREFCRFIFQRTSKTFHHTNEIVN